MIHLTRRRLLQSAGAALSLVVAPRYSSAEQAYKGERLKVFTYAGPWGDVFQNHFVQGFADQTGATVVLDLGWWDSIPKLKASPPGDPAFDLIMTDATQGYPAIREGLFQPVDFSRIPNMKNFAPAMLDNWVVKENWGITWPDALGAGAYNTQRVAPPPARWADLLKPEFDKQIGLYNSFYMSLFTLAAVKVDSEGRAGQAHEEIDTRLDDVLNFAKEQAPRVNLWWASASDMVVNLTQTNVLIGNCHSPALFQAMGEPESNVGMFAPLEDRAFVQLFWVVAKDSKKKDIAEAAIDYFCGVEFQTAYAKNAGFVTPIQSVAAAIGKENSLYARVNPTTAQEFEALQYFPYDTYAKNWDHIVQFWDKQVLRS